MGGGLKSLGTLLKDSLEEGIKQAAHLKTDTVLQFLLRMGG